ncbi:TetR/AcrR family transcriptional regulator [Kineosporia sp. NBRC 101731]|uniref:TetR/AcrR family transcriptional regulator n=1 Tax=Kineosporia sp. NBRC 101731 TaxID=3032199 RepID=UPI0024A0F840|nr:TetR/AcrR family transcriptional regulator [Kineosporia sp. NBRC 101731]GLY27659.1 AcrR family transcriptional regulator [Kineosporia sp. NBRC 101731]
MALTDAAEVVLAREGPGGVTVRAVATEAGVAPMGVYNRFGSKDGLVGALLMRGFAGLTEAITVPGETDAITRMWLAGVRYREYALAHRSHYALMFGDRLGGDELPPDLVACLDGSFAVLVDRVAVLIAAGYFTAGDPELIAQQVWSAVHGAVSLELAGRRKSGDAEAGYRQLLRMVFRGFAVPGALVFPDPDGPPVPA